MNTKTARTCLFLMCALLSRAVLADADAVLEQVLQNYTKYGAQTARSLAAAHSMLIRDERGMAMVPVIVNRALTRRSDFATKLARAQAGIDALSRDYCRILVPMPRLRSLIDAFPGEQLRAPFPAHPVSSIGYGSIVSQSVSLTAADGYQVGNLTGSGIKAAVVDLGFAQLSNAITNGELPATACDAAHSMDFTGTGLQTTTKHGTGVAEHLVDMAPGVELYCLKVADQVDLQNAADYLVTNNIRIANHSVSWVISSYYDDTGPINSIIDNSFDTDGVFWAVAAGNSARQHWRGTWTDTNGNKKLEFSGSDELLALSGSSANVTVFLNWNQYGAANKADLKLTVVDANGVTVATSDVNQALSDPAEAVSFSSSAGTAPFSVEVQRNSNSSSVNGLDITLFSFDHNFEYPVAATSVADPASAHGAFTVGAVNQSLWTNANPAIRGYSSRGPTTDGRQKPQLVAPDGTSSLTYSIANGTSFSSPTTAGAAALLLQENPALTASGVASLLTGNAIDVGATGTDSTYGAGKLQLPLIDSDGDGLTNVEEIQLGTDPLKADTDGDGLSDFEETNTYNTDPLNADTDGDGLSDYQEVITYHTNPLASNLGDLAPRGAPDGTLNAGDYVVLSRLVSGTTSPTALESTLGDLNNNGALDGGDLVLLARIVEGQIPPP